VPLKTALACAALALLGAPLAACRGATEISLDVRTNIACTSSAAWKGVAISVGQPGVDVESRAPVLTTTACSASGEVGSLVIVPTGANDAEVGIRVVAGITRNPEDCAANGYDGCIVSRRTLTYLPHQTQNVVVDLTSDCIGSACDVNHTCVNGSCTDTVTATAPVAADGGVYSAGPTVRCGDDGTRCPVNDLNLACCVTFDLDAGTGKGTCVAAAACPSTSAVVYCDDSSECPPLDGAIVVCCATTSSAGPRTLTNADCEPQVQCGGNGGGTSLCEDRQPCPNSQGNCGPEPAAPGYFTCGSD
jgi:hypothetical protein